MRRQVKFLILPMILAGILMPSVSVLAYSGVISVDTVKAAPGEQIGVPVRLSSNDMPISGLNIPLKFFGPNLSIDSVSFAGSILPTDFDGYVAVDNASGELKISYIAKFVTPIPTLSVTGGLVGTIFMSVSPSAAPGLTIPIDSVNIDTVVTDGGPATHIWQKIHASDNTGTVVLWPEFEGGAVVVKAPTGIDDGVEPFGMPTAFSLSQNYPNPFNPATVIEFALPQAGDVKLEVFNILGQKVATLVDRRLSAGSHQVEFDADSFPSGIYFYRLTHNEGSLTQKMTLVK